MRLIFFAAMGLLAAAPAQAQTIYPIDRAEILAGSRFDFKVELPSMTAQADIRVTVNGQDIAASFGKPAAYTAREDGKDQSALIMRDVALDKPGRYVIAVKAGDAAREIAWEVYETGTRKAKNVILFIGDGMSPAHRVAARILSKGIAEGRARGKLAIDDMPQMALVATAGSDSIITDSANSASAYATGHKAAVNAMGVYADRTADPLDDPKVETIASLAKSRLGMAIGIVTNTEIEDATPAAMIAHTRRRAGYDNIVAQFFAAKPDVLLGGGSAHFLPKGSVGSRRADGEDYIQKFRDAGYAYAATAQDLKAAASEGKPLLGLFHAGNMDGALDRKFLKGGSVGNFPDQPDLTEQVSAALNVLSRKPEGFFLMVESGLIDKYAHALDMERSVYDTIMLDNAVAQTLAWAKARGDDTLILVLADHNHPIALVGTIEDDMSATPTSNTTPMREKVRVYQNAGFPNYPPPDAQGYPARVDVSRRLAMFSAGLPDHYETFRPKLDNPNQPTVSSDGGAFAPNEKYRDVPGSVLRAGNLSRLINSSVHSGEDVILTATGPGSERVRGSLDNTDVFRIMAEALGLGQPQRVGAAKP